MGEKVVGKKTTADGAETSRAFKRPAEPTTSQKPLSKKAKKAREKKPQPQPSGSSQASSVAVLPQPTKVIQSEAEKKLDAKKRAVEIYKKSQASKKKRQKGTEIKRKVLQTHNLSESD